MSSRMIERAMWILGAVGLVVAGIGWRGGVARQPLLEGPIAEGTDSLTDVDAALIAENVERIVTNDVFRATRRPSPVAFAPTADGIPIAPPARPSRPQLAVTGIIGPPWEAVLEGVPGRDGSVVARVGDSFGDLRVHEVRRDTVVVRGADTTWRLAVRRAW
ncbi:MAG TPA: hypothetical protein VHM30_17910 [Gemmatimonadaceae bacterium]|nr:hypothetical protein [Gemmatimonadaceae bacterium]